MVCPCCLRCCCIDGVPSDTELAGEAGFGECEGESFPKPSEPEDCQCTVILTWCGYTLTLAPNTLVVDQYVIDPFECEGDNGPREFDRVQLQGEWVASTPCNSCFYEPTFRVFYYKAGQNIELAYIANKNSLAETGIEYNAQCGLTEQWQRFNSLVAGPNNDYLADSFPCAPCDELPEVTFDCNPAP
jgi:hypothetical protein